LPATSCHTSLIDWSSTCGHQLDRGATCFPPRLHHRSGFARFTNTRYSNKKEDITNTFMHLTNVAIQKHAPGFDASKVGL
jgi:hypothetical protein